MEAVTSTTGEQIDPDGYALSVDGESARRIGLNGRVTIDGLAAGEHTMELKGVAPNCTVAGDNPRTLRVAVGATAQTTFDVSCAPTAWLNVTVTSGFSPLQYASVTAAGPGGPHTGTTGGDGTVQFRYVEPGSFAVVVTVAGEPCASPQTATVSAGQTANVTVTCAPGAVSGQVTVNGVGEPDVFVHLFLARITTGPGGRYQFTAVLPGRYTVGIEPWPGATCPTTSQDFLLPPGGMVTVDFACTR